MTLDPAQSPPDDHAADLAQAAAQFFPASEVVPIPPSQHLVRVETATGDAAVRQWPAATTNDHVEFVHALHATLRDAGVSSVAAILPVSSREATVLALNGRLYDARTWLPGAPLGESDLSNTGELVDLPKVVSQQALRALIETIANVHTASTALPRHGQRLTIQQLRSAARQFWQIYRERLRPVAAVNPPIQHWLRTGERVFPLALSLIEQEPELTRQMSVVGHHRVWPAHVLGQRHDGEFAISGLVGLSDPAWGSPLLDLAQIGTRFARWSPDLIEELIGTYGAVRRLTPVERRLLPAVATLDLIIQSGRMLDVAYGPRGVELPPAAGAPAVLAAEAMVASLEAVSATLTAVTPRERSKGPPWPRGRRGQPGQHRRGPSRQRREDLA